MNPPRADRTERQWPSFDDLLELLEREGVWVAI